MLPSKKIIITALLCIVIVSVVVNNKIQQNKQATTANNLSLVAVQTPDPETIRTQLQNKILASASQNTGANSKNSITKNLSQDFAQNYLVLKNSGTLNTQNEAKLIQNLSSTYATTSQLSFQLKDILTFSDLDKEKTRTFGNTAAKIIISHYQTLKTSPLDIISADQSSNSTSTLALELAPLAKSYRIIVLDLEKTPAPANLAANYLEIVNGYAHLADDIDNMSVYFSDSVRGFIGINNYSQDIVTQINLLKTAADYFASNGILFSSTDSGKIWSSLTQ
jgi:hypothetical protein